MARKGVIQLNHCTLRIAYADRWAFCYHVKYKRGYPSVNYTVPYTIKRPTSSAGYMNGLAYSSRWREELYKALHEIGHMATIKRRVCREESDNIKYRSCVFCSIATAFTELRACLYALRCLRKGTVYYSDAVNLYYDTMMTVTRTMHYRHQSRVRKVIVSALTKEGTIE